MAAWQLQDEMRNIWFLGVGDTYNRGLMVDKAAMAFIFRTINTSRAQTSVPASLRIMEQSGLAWNILAHPLPPPSPRPHNNALCHIKVLFCLVLCISRLPCPRIASLIWLSVPYIFSHVTDIFCVLLVFSCVSFKLIYFVKVRKLCNLRLIRCARSRYNNYLLRI